MAALGDCEPGRVWACCGAGRGKMPCMPRMADCGGLMMGVDIREPKTPPGKQGGAGWLRGAAALRGVELQVGCMGSQVRGKAVVSPLVIEKVPPTMSSTVRLPSLALVPSRTISCARLTRPMHMLCTSYAHAMHMRCTSGAHAAAHMLG